VFSQRRRARCIGGQNVKLFLRGPLTRELGDARDDKAGASKLEFFAQPH